MKNKLVGKNENKSQLSHSMNSVLIFEILHSNHHEKGYHDMGHSLLWAPKYTENIF